MSKIIDMKGQKFGRLTVIEPAPPPYTTKSRQQHWLCQCDCGNFTIVLGTSLRIGHTRSCGCMWKERTREALTVHGLSDSRLYNIYRRMKDRCYNPNNKGYKYYGGREIKICQIWLNEETGLQSFVEWSLKNGYADNLSIDRIDVNGNYEPSNCRWVNASIQGFNKRPRSNKTGHVGVYKTQNEKYMAVIFKNKLPHRLGTFNTYEEAVKARERAERELYPELYQDAAKEQGHIADGDTPQKTQNYQTCRKTPFFRCGECQCTTKNDECQEDD